MALYEHGTYREVIAQKLLENAQVRGYKSQLAKAMKVQNSYFSQVMSGDAELSLDQAATLCDYWLLDSSESEFFLSLVGLERAGTPALQQRMKDRLERLRNECLGMPKLELTGVKMDFEHAFDYFSSWMLPVVHTALEIESLRTVAAIAQRFDLPQATITKCLEKLKGMDLVEESGGRWTSKEMAMVSNYARIHNIFHGTLRNRARDLFSNGDEEGRHYTAVYTLRKKDFMTIREKLVDLVREAEKLSEAADREEVVGVALDFFRFGRS